MSSAAPTTDAVVVGAGINGMVAAAELAMAGWSVRLLDRNPAIGGFIATEERTLPGYQHETFSSWHPLFVSGPAHAALGEHLGARGLSYANTDGVVTGSVADDGTVTLAHRDPAVTAAGFADPDDRLAYAAALDRFIGQADLIGDMLGMSLHTRAVARPLWRFARRQRARTLDWGRDLASSGRGYCRREFRGREVDHLWVPWLLHAGLSPDSASGGLFVPVLAATMHGFGLPIPVGGSVRFLDAFRSLLTDHGVDIVTGAHVHSVVVRGGRAVAVRAGNEQYGAARAVIASVTPQALYLDLLRDVDVPVTVRRGSSRYRPGRAAMQVHVALSGPVPWQDAALADVPLLHLSDGSASTGIACAQAEAGLLPDRPTVVVGQQHVLDPSRVPDGAAALWLQLQEVPAVPLGDAGGSSERGGIDAAGAWTADVRDRYVERVLARIERHAPGLRERILAVDVLTPDDIRAHNPNALGGDPYAGSAELDQNFLWRPLPGADHRTPVPGLWHIGASTHPGPGLGGTSGHIVAQRLLTAARRGRLAAAARARFA